MKKLLLLFIFLLVGVFMLMGCEAVPDSTSDPSDETTPKAAVTPTMELILGEGDEASIRLIGVDPYPNGYDVFYLYWRQLSQLRDDILNERLVGDKLPFILRFPKNEDGTYRIYNPATMVHPTLPSDITPGGVYWEGERYEIECSFEDGVNKEGYGSISFYTENAYRTYFDTNYTRYFDTVTVLSKETITDRNALQAVIKEGNCEKKILQYTIAVETGRILVQEEYILSNDSSASVSIPNDIRLFCEKDGAFFVVALQKLGERPTVEWLSSFGAAPLEQMGTPVSESESLS